MNIFFGSIFIKKEKLKEAGINYPIKLEYYKIINEDEMLKKQNPKFGIKIVKTQYDKDNTTESEEIKYMLNDEEKIEEILKIFKENEVTPISMHDIITDFSKKIITI